ncbi:MAG: carboxypeptidase-like regulatory domain-containing protein [Flavobacteriales bacterium]|nr:carboxypeptidase-like regulatory domain-containing protein [Flavobacteriales bacterium]
MNTKKYGCLLMLQLSGASLKIKRYILNVILLFIGFSSLGQSISGFVMDEDNAPMPYVNVYIKHTSLGTVTDEQGKYYIQLKSEGDYELVFSLIGYETKTVQVVLKQVDISKNVYLRPSQMQLDELVIKAKRRDPAYEIVQQAIDTKKKNSKQVNTSQCDVYIKASEIISEKEKKKRAILREQKQMDKERESEDFVPVSPEKKLQQERMELANSLNIVEIQMQRNYQYPNSVKEIRNAVKKLGSSEGLYFLNTVDDQYDFYQNLVDLSRLNELPLVSPLNTTSILTYKFKLEATYFEEKQMIYHIKVVPRKQGNATFSGYIDIMEGSFAIRKVDLKIEKGGLLIYDEFRIQQDYKLVNDSIWVVIRQEFDYKSKAGKSRFKGNTKVVYSNYDLNVEFPKRYFKNELAVTTKEAYERDTTYWGYTRPEPLSLEEQRIVFIKDSILAAHTKKEYLDSIDAAYNKITVGDLLLYGVGKFNREKKTHIYTSGLAEFIDPFQIGGITIGPDFLYFKKYEDQQSIMVYLNTHIGIRNMDVKGDFQVWYHYNPFKLSNLYFDVGHDFDVVQNTEAVTAYMDRANYVEQTYGEVGHSTEVFNGFYFNVFLEYAENRPLDGYKFGEATEYVIENNRPRSFTAYQMLVSYIELEYTPFQKYITEPYRKIVLGSKWPTFRLYYKKGYKNVFGSDLDFDFLEGSIKQRFKLGTAGTSTYKVATGKFLRDNVVSYEQYKVFPRGDNWFFGSPMENQLQDTTLIATDWFFEAHYIHHFNGAIVNYVPLIKKLRIQTLAGGNYTYIPESDYHYIDFYVGLERIIKIQRQRFRLGLYGVYGLSSFQKGKPTLQISINHYDQREKSWGY